MANSTLEPAKTAEPRATKPSLAKALQSIFSKSEEPDESKAIAKRRRFVMAAVLGTLSVNLLMFLRFFFPRALYEPKTKFKIGYPSDSVSIPSSKTNTASGSCEIRKAFL